MIKVMIMVRSRIRIGIGIGIRIRVSLQAGQGMPPGSHPALPAAAGEPLIHADAKVPRDMVELLSWQELPEDATISIYVPYAPRWPTRSKYPQPRPPLTRDSVTHPVASSKSMARTRPPACRTAWDPNRPARSTPPSKASKFRARTQTPRALKPERGGWKGRGSGWCLPASSTQSCKPTSMSASTDVSSTARRSERMSCRSFTKACAWARGFAQRRTHWCRWTGYGRPTRQRLRAELGDVCEGQASRRAC